MNSRLSFRDIFHLITLCESLCLLWQKFFEKQSHFPKINATLNPLKTQNKPIFKEIEITISNLIIRTKEYIRRTGVAKNKPKQTHISPNSQTMDGKRELTGNCASGLGTMGETKGLFGRLS